MSSGPASLIQWNYIDSAMPLPANSSFPPLKQGETILLLVRGLHPEEAFVSEGYFSSDTGWMSLAKCGAHPGLVYSEDGRPLCNDVIAWADFPKPPQIALLKRFSQELLREWNVCSEQNGS